MIAVGFEDELPRRGLYDLPDPNRAVLETAIKRGTSVRVYLLDTPIA